MSLKGFVEKVSGVSINGWCWDTEQPDHSLEVQIELNDSVVVTTRANRLRRDLVAAGAGNGRYGFRCMLPFALSDDDQRRIEVFAVTGDGRMPLRRLDAPPEAVAPVRSNLVGRRIPHCILHIGTEKTGTTSLQGYLARNYDALRALGILAPRSLALQGGEGILNHVDLVNYAFGEKKFTKARIGERVSQPAEDLDGFRTAVESRICNEIEAAGPDCELLLLSSEYCHSRLNQADELERLRNLLLSLADRVDVVVYLRPQHELGVSLFTTALRNGEVETVVLPDLDQGVDPRTKWATVYYNYDSLVAQWESAFGADNVDVRLYGAEVVGDFFARLPQDKFPCARFVGLIRPTARHNTRLSAYAQRIFHSINRMSTFSGAADVVSLRHKLYAVLLENATDDPGLLPTRQQAERFQQHFESSNERLRSRRFPQSITLFNLDFGGYPALPMRMEASAEELAETLMKVLRQATRS